MWRDLSDDPRKKKSILLQLLVLIDSSTFIIEFNLQVLGGDKVDYLISFARTMGKTFLRLC